MYLFKRKTDKVESDFSKKSKIIESENESHEKKESSSEILENSEQGTSEPQKTMDLGEKEKGPAQPQNINFPVNANKRHFSDNWYKTFVWLEYSKSLDAAFCFACRNFISQNISKMENAFTEKGVTSWKKALEKFRSHETAACHRQAMESWANFKESKKSGSVVEKAESASLEIIKKRRRHLDKIISVLLLTGRQGIAQRGHFETEDSKNRGNFLEILEVVNKYDPNQSDMPLNAHYCSPSSQNELLDISSKIVQEKIVKEMEKSGYYSILADDTKDKSKKEQMSICVRYVYENCIFERFLCFAQVIDLTSEGLCNVLCTKIKELGINAICVGQGYDGAAVMSGKVAGLQERFRKEHELAVYVHCYAHRLNLVLVHICSKISEVSDFFEVLKSLHSFFSHSGKAHQRFVEIQKEL